MVSWPAIRKVMHWALMFSSSAAARPDCLSTPVEHQPEQVAWCPRRRPAARRSAISWSTGAFMKRVVLLALALRLRI